MDQRTFILGYIKTHEGGLSTDPNDVGNWCKGVCVGSNFGVTGDALCRFRGVPCVTAEDIADLKVDEAADIALKDFYHGPGLDQLVWNQVSASVLDMAWGTGPGQAVKLLQRLIGCADDGQVGPYTARAFADYLANHGLEATAETWGDIRNRFYDRIIQIRPSNAVYRKGWRNRTASFLPGTSWWASWQS